MADKDILLSVKNLTVEYTSEGEIIHAVNNVSFDLEKGKITISAMISKKAYNRIWEKIFFTFCEEVTCCIFFSPIVEIFFSDICYLL